MKRFIQNLTAGLALATLTGAATQLAAAPLPNPTGTDDTIVVKMSNDAVMTLVVKNAKDLEKFQQHSLDSLMKMLSTYVTKVETMETTKDGKKVEEKTVYFYPAKEKGNANAPGEIKITVTEGAKSGGTTSETVTIGGDFTNKLKINVEYDENQNVTKITTGKPAANDSIQLGDTKKKDSRWDQSFNIDLGFNTFTNSSINPDFDLKPFGSRYVSIGSIHTVRVGGEKSPLHVRTGVEFAFNNYMFETNKVLIDEDNKTKFEIDTERNIRKIEKQKLATSTVELPLMLMLQFKDSKGKDAFRFGAGGFGGYRLGAHTKLKYENDNGREIKDKDHGNFNLEDLQYGVRASIGYRDIDFFAKYNMNSLFKDTRGPDTNVISFGITL